MVNRSFLCEVDFIPSKHRVSEFLHPGFPSKIGEQVQGFIGNKVLGKIKQNGVSVGGVLEGSGELREALWIMGEEFLKYQMLAGGGMVFL